MLNAETEPSLDTRHVAQSRADAAQDVGQLKTVTEVHQLPCKVVLTAGLRTVAICVMAPTGRHRDACSSILRGSSSRLKPRRLKPKHVLSTPESELLITIRAERPCPEEMARPPSGGPLRSQLTNAGVGAPKLIALAPQRPTASLSAPTFHPISEPTYGRPKTRVLSAMESRVTPPSISTPPAATARLDARPSAELTMATVLTASAPPELRAASFPARPSPLRAPQKTGASFRRLAYAAGTSIAMPMPWLRRPVHEGR